MKTFRKIIWKICKVIGFGLGAGFLALAIIVARAILWWKDFFQLVEFSQIIFNLLGPMDGANMDVFQDFASMVIPQSCWIAFFVAIGLLILAGIYAGKLEDDKETFEDETEEEIMPAANADDEKKKFDFRVLFSPFYYLKKFFFVITLVAFLGITIFGLCKIGAMTYLINFFGNKSKIYEQEYVDPDSVELSFPDEKRNLIYIFCESMENSYMGAADGGAQEENYIPELTQLMKDNTSFYNPETTNGGLVEYNCDWTVAAMVAQTSGVPMCLPLGENDYEAYHEFLPGLTSLGDILEEEGYNQELVIGSDARFGGRSNYFRTHGNYEIFDYYTAIELGYLPEEYYVWWGYEDIKLFTYAKGEILKQAEKGEPFNVTLLTVDTHFIQGYYCNECIYQYNDNYLNALACSSRQLNAFIEWIKEQDFYENTTIVVAGDHLNMGGEYISAIPDSYNRTGYFTIINPADEYTGDTSRSYSTMDYFPTTLAALGVEIEGDRLGFGTNLFSDEETLTDIYGFDKLHQELEKNSLYYEKNFLIGKEEK